MAKPKVHPLVADIKKNPNIKKDPEFLGRMVSLGELFVENLKENLILDGFELDEKYMTYNQDDWLTFLTLPPVSTYRKKNINALASVRAERELVDGTSKIKDAMSLRDDIERREAKESNAKFVIFRLPVKDRYREQ